MMMHKSRIIPFRKKESPFERINKALNAVRIALNFVCISAGLLSLGYVLWCS